MSLASTGGRAIFASGSPFPDVSYDGQKIASSQCNNRYIFPGLALGAALGQTGVVTNAMINKSAEVRMSNDDTGDDLRKAVCDIQLVYDNQGTIQDHLS